MVAVAGQTPVRVLVGQVPPFRGQGPVAEAEAEGAKSFM